MKAVKNILILADADDKLDHLLERAKILATSFQASISIFMNKPNVLSADSAAPRSLAHRLFKTQQRQFAEHYQQQLENIGQRFQAEGIKVRTEFSSAKNHYESILGAITRFKPDLTLKSIQRHNALRRIIISNTDWQLIKDCASPLLLIKRQNWQAEGSIIAAVDPLHAKAQQNELDHLILDTSRALAAKLELNIRVFHNYLPDITHLFPKVLDADDYIREVHDRHQEKLLELLAEHDLTVDSLLLTRGDLVKALLSCIRKQQANILVLGALSRNFVERAIVGSTAERILYDTPCDVLVLKNDSN
ncbi:MAG: universal stress protein [Pseudomonadales bacterium]|nr:universal stress protein [Pseudomonadales bacterium]